MQGLATGAARKQLLRLVRLALQLVNESAKLLRNGLGGDTVVEAPQSASDSVSNLAGLPVGGMMCAVL